MATCIKTGCSVFIECTNSWAYGDAFRIGDVTWFRLCEHSFKGPIRDVMHFTVHDYAAWHDERATSMKQNSTMICGPSCVIDHGYGGVPI
jgi:hypothetical protein